MADHDQPPVTDRPEIHHSHAAEKLAESTADPAGAKDRSTAESETSGSQSDEISKAQALMNGVGEVAGQVLDGVKDLAKQAGDLVRQATVVGVITAASLVHPMADVRHLSDQIGSAGGEPTTESGPTAGTTNAVGEHGDTTANAIGGKAESVSAASAETPEPQDEETPAQKLGEDLDKLLDETNKDLRENDERNRHPVVHVIDGESVPGPDPEDNQE